MASDRVSRQTLAALVGRVGSPDPAEPADAHQIEILYTALGGPELPKRTHKLSSASMVKKAKKLVEEASEMGFEAVFGRRRGVIEESADLIYHMVMLWRATGVKPAEIWREMDDRVKTLGVAEKLPKK